MAEINLGRVVGKSAFEYARDGGFAGTEEDFKQEMNAVPEVREKVEEVDERLTDIYVNVKSFGAVGDGVTDDKTAFLNALSYTVDNERTLYIPNGKYQLNNLTFSAFGQLKIVGQSKEKTILHGIGMISAHHNIYISNITTLNTLGVNTITIIPKEDGASIVDIDNVYASNDYDFTDSSIANKFVSYTNSDSTGKNSLLVRIIKCHINNFASSAFFLRGRITGSIENNTITNIGYAANLKVQAIFCGYQDLQNVITGPAVNLLIRNNVVKNLYSAYGLNERGECQGILCYGSTNTIDGNSLSDFFGGGKDNSNLESGYDHEGIYIKSTDTIISNNFLSNTSGDSSAGAICAKVSNNTTIKNNKIRGLYGYGIVSQGSTNLSIVDNSVELSGITQVVGSGVFCISIDTSQQGLGYADNAILNNRFICNRAGATFSTGCVELYGSGNCKVTNNYMLSSGNAVLKITSLGKSDASIISNALVSDNYIVSNVTTRVIYCSGFDTNGTMTFVSNKIINKTGTNIMYCTSVEGGCGKYIFENNIIDIDMFVLIYLRIINPAQYIIRNNNFVSNYTEVTASGDAILASVTHNATTKQNINIISDNVLIGDFSRYLLYSFSSSYNIGTLIIKNNILDLYTGRLFYSDQTVYADHVGIFNNVLRSTRSTYPILNPSIISESALLESGNVVR